MGERGALVCGKWDAKYLCAKEEARIFQNAATR